MDEEIKDVEKLMIIKQEIQNLKPFLTLASDKIIEEDVSKYPIFVMHKQEVALGIPLIDKEKHLGRWSINVSSLEEFAVKKLIVDKKIDEFRETYKNPKTHFCVFVLSDMGAQFLFIPRKA